MAIALWSGLWDDVRSYFADSAQWTEWSIAALKIVIIFIVSRMAIRILNKAVKHIADDKDRLRFNPRRTATIVRLMGNIVKYAINFVMLLMILGELGVPIGPMLAGAGVVGLAVGFGAQSLVKDVITGFFIIFEDQFAVGDVIQTGSFKGTVEEIGLRVTRIRSWTGEVHIIPNGSIAEVTNYSIHNSLAVIDISVAYEMDIDKATQVIQETVSRVHEETEDIVKLPVVLGVQALAASEVVIRVTCECKPNTQAGVARLLNAEIKKSLDANGIEIPYPRVVTYYRNDKAE